MAANDRAEFGGTERFRILSRLGAGGMGVVYEALDQEHNARVALKTLRTLDAEGILRFKQEFRALADLQHPNLISLGELIEDGGQWFFTMELVRGVDFLTHTRPATEAGEADATVRDLSYTTTTLRASMRDAMAEASYAEAVTGRGTDELSAARGFDERLLRSALGQLAIGLCTLHAARKVHRDIKPSNIIVTAEGRVVLLDFGLVTDLVPSQWESAPALSGTVAYMAPEQAASRPIEPASDWYAVGVVLYEALTGQLPFVGAPLKVLVEKQRSDPPAPGALVAGVPADLDALCMELLNRDPAQRPAGNDVLRRLLSDGAGGESSASVEASNVSVLVHRSSGGGSAPFVGRNKELCALHAAFEDTRRGEAVALLVSGESGMGKTALVRQFTDQLVALPDNVVVLAGRCYERESVPYKALDGVIDSLTRYLMQLGPAELGALLPPQASMLAHGFPVLRRVESIARAPRPTFDVRDPHELRGRVFAAMRELFIRLRKRHPLVLVIDDLHWADADSFLLIGELMREPGAPALLLVATTRPQADTHSDQPGLAAFLGRNVRQIEVDRLSAREGLALATLLAAGTERFATPEGRQKLAAIADEAGGHPLFLDELLRHAHSPSAPETGPVQLEEAFQTRFAELDPGARQVLVLVAIAAAPVPQNIAVRASSIDADDFARRVSMLRVAHLVRTTGARGSDAIEPYHDRVRQAVLSTLSSTERRQAHEQLALAMEADGDAPSRPLGTTFLPAYVTDPEALSVHWQGAGHAAKAARYAALAGTQAAQSLAFERAVRLFRHALELRGGERDTRDAPVTSRCELNASLGEALANAGRGKEAADAYLEAARGSNEGDALDLRRRAAEQLLRCGRMEEGSNVLRTVLAAIDMKLPATTRSALASMLARRAQIRLRSFNGFNFTERKEWEIPPSELKQLDICWAAAIGLAGKDNLRSGYFQARYLLLALKAGEPHRIARGISLEAGFGSLAGEANREQTRKYLELAEQLARRTQNSNALGLVAFLHGFAACMEGRWKAGLELCDRAEKLIRDRCTGAAWELANSELYAVHALGALGELAELARRLPLYLRESEERGDLYAQTNLRIGNSNLAWLARGDVAEARREAAEGLRRWLQVAGSEFTAEHHLELAAQSQLDLYCRCGDVALERINKSWKAHGFFLQVASYLATLHDLRGRAALQCASLEVANMAAHVHTAANAAKELARVKVAWAKPAAELLAAGVAAVSGELTRATELYARAGETFAAAGMGLHAAASRRRHGELLGGDAGRALVSQAEQWMRGQQIKDPERMAEMLAPSEVKSAR